MYIKNRKFALIYRGMLFFVCGIGLFITLGLHRGRFSLASLVYYTTLSNLVCFLFYIPTIANNASKLKGMGEPDATFAPRIKGAIVIMITITFTIYHVFLANVPFPIYTGGDFAYYIQNLITHYIVPIMVIIDWLLFDPKQTLRTVDPLLWLLIPAAYAAFAIVRAQLGDVLPGRTSRYPYYFLDFDAMGSNGVFRFFAVFLLVYLSIGYALVALDRYVFRKKG